MSEKTQTKTYKDAGVDVEAGDALVDWLQEQDSNRHHRDRIVDGIGGFASLFRIGFPEMKKPCIVTCTDGVGTKVKLAAQYQRYSEVGQDLVAMCVNDLICTGGKPLLFLDYYASGKLDLKAAKGFLQSVRRACDESNCALVGGETAEMPGIYAENDFDCAGFAVGIVDEEKTLGAHQVRRGDVLLGVASSGFHSNGFSLLRKLFAKDLDEWIDQLMIPTRLYVKFMAALQLKVELHAVAHITGGGMENVPRVLPKELVWKRKSWEMPKAFLEVQKRTGLSSEQMQNTLNCGIGFVLVLPPSQLSAAQKICQEFGYEHFDLGSV